MRDEYDFSQGERGKFYQPGAWLRRLFRRPPVAAWKLYGRHEKDEPVFLGDFSGTADAAEDECRERWMNWLWHAGAFKAGESVSGAFWAVPTSG
jgi:hypothetical protein